MIFRLSAMVQIYRVAATEAVGRAGYTARYIADLTFQRPLHTCGVILVDITERGRSSPHAHEKLEEVFIAITDINMYVNETCFNLKAGDVVIVSPGETHSFEITSDKLGRIIALKFPNIKDDKVVPGDVNTT